MELKNITSVEEHYTNVYSPDAEIGDTIEKEKNDYKVTHSGGIITIIPKHESNRHYLQIQEWIADGGTIIDNGGGE